MAHLKTTGIPRPTSVPSSAADARRARDQLLQKFGKQGSLPAFGSLILRVVQLASSDSEAVHNLATFILSDVALTQKVLHIANSVGYRPSAGKQITTISKAIFVLGFETIKTVALALLLVDSMAGKRGEAVRAELMRALAASTLAREMAQRSQYRDAEEAAVAALFKNIGQVLVASSDHDAYSQIEALVASGRTLNQAATQTIGCGYDMLADAVLREWKIPETIISAMQALPPGVVKPPRSRQEWAQQVAGFAEAAAGLILQPPPRGDRTPYRALLARFGAALQVDQEMLLALMRAAERETHILSTSANLEELTEHLKQRQQRAKTPAGEDEEEEQGADAEAEAAEEAAADAPHLDGLPADLILSAEPVKQPDAEGRYPSGKPLNARDLLLTGVQDVTDVMASRTYKLNDLITLVLETLYQGLGCRFATIVLKDARTAQFRARISLGEMAEARQSAFAFPAAPERDIFHLAMENDADLLITESRDAKIVGLIPEWHKRLLPDARSFIVLPLVVRGKAVGFFYADRKKPADEGVPPDETALIKTLKGQVLVALNAHAG